MVSKVFLTQLFLFFGLLLGFSVADTPANCTYDDIVGEWTFKIGILGGDNTLNCSQYKATDAKSSLKLQLKFPNAVFDEFGNQGYWTLIYNQGFEVVINYRKYFAFSKFETDGKSITSICDETLAGWSHNVIGMDWSCFLGKKESGKYVGKATINPKNPKVNSKMYLKNENYIRQINQVQDSWKATHYKEHELMTLEEITRKAGGKRMYRLPQVKPASASQRAAAASLPDQFDWRNINKVNFVTPVRNQASCGSCFAFASAAMYEARLKVMTNNSRTVIISPQDVVQCSEYSQGCSGGFPYLIAGKYAEDFGFVEESCLPYTGKDGVCPKNASQCSTPRHYATGYNYVGGYYGACNEDLMRVQLVKNGPMAISFEVYADFMNYKSGIYHHTGLEDHFNPFEITNHAVLLVGYGSDQKTGEKFWLVKNSWGEGWGEEGYFRIRRGTDECSIESLAVETFPIP